MPTPGWAGVRRLQIAIDSNRAGPYGYLREQDPSCQSDPRIMDEGQRNDVADSKESPMTMLSRRISALACGVAGAILAAVAPAQAADRVTYYDDVAPILRASCQSCHQPVGRNMGALVAPMSLMTYEEARPWRAPSRAGSSRARCRPGSPRARAASSRTSAA